MQVLCGDTCGNACRQICVIVLHASQTYVRGLSFSSELGGHEKAGGVTEFFHEK